jgi:hypothetical protein
LQATYSVEPPPEIAEVLEPKTPATEPVEQAPPAPPEDLLKKWFEAYGLNKPPPSAPAPEPQHDAGPSEPVAKPPAQTEPIVTVEQPAPELPVTESTDTPPPASSILQMPIPGRARFVRLWRVQIHAVQSYRL